MRGSYLLTKKTLVMKKILLILFACAIAATSVHQTMAGNKVVAQKMADYNVFVANSTDGFVAVYFTGEESGLRGYVSPGIPEMFGPLPEGTYELLITTNSPGTHTFTVNGQSVTSSNGMATFTVNVNTNVYITVV